MPPGPSELPAPAAALIVLDGWGLAPDGPGNAISLADTPVFDELWSTYPHTQLTACGRAVGLPEGQMGNSEVGHMNLGAGAVVMQDLTRIDEAVDQRRVGDPIAVLRAAFSDAERVHLIGLVSDGGVHSGWAHLEALIRMGAALGVPDLVLHAFTDGRDTLPTAGAGYLETVAGLDGRCRRRPDRFGRRPLLGDGPRPALGPDPARVRPARPRPRRAPRRVGGRGGARGVRARRDRRVHHADAGRRLEARIRPGDSVFAFNFRPDRMREITRALAEPASTRSTAAARRWSSATRR